jgi:formimidoylglutamate deiminase
MTTKIWAEQALLADGWAESIEITVDAGGNIESVTSASADTDAERAGVLIPAIPNVHSHAHQRAMAGLGERAGNREDSFWTWPR